MDGFSGPWRSEDENFGDTSFFIAIETLRHVREGVKEKWGKRKQVRCIFVEKDPQAFADLERFVATVGDIPIETIPGEFEQAIPRLIKLIGSQF